MAVHSSLEGRSTAPGAVRMSTAPAVHDAPVEHTLQHTAELGRDMQQRAALRSEQWHMQAARLVHLRRSAGDLPPDKSAEGCSIEQAGNGFVEHSLLGACRTQQHKCEHDRHKSPTS